VTTFDERQWGISVSAVNHLDSTWIVTSTLTPSEAFDRLKPALDESDRVLIVNITGDTYSGWLTQKAWDWLNEHV
jgi:hypothetical protein